MNFLEQLVAEWYAYRGFFVRTNIKFGKRAKGGYKGEMDVVAFHPQGRTLVHIEASSDAYSWPKRKEMFRKKFQIEEQLYASEFGFEFEKVVKVAVVSFTQPREPVEPVELGCDKLFLVRDLMRWITSRLRSTHPMKAAVPEVYPLLRAIQFAVWSDKDDG